MLSYRPLWETLKSKNHTVYWLMKQGIDKKTIYNLQHNKNTTLLTMERVCKILECKINEVVEFSEEEEHK